MCITTPKQQAAPLPPVTETFDESGNVAANKEAEMRRRQYIVSKMKTTQSGAMQGESAAAGKQKLGE